MNQFVDNRSALLLKAAPALRASFDVCLPNPAVDLSKMIGARLQAGTSLIVWMKHDPCMPDNLARLATAQRVTAVGAVMTGVDVG